jgi:hypothetical protein
VARRTQPFGQVDVWSVVNMEAIPS